MFQVSSSLLNIPGGIHNSSKPIQTFNANCFATRQASLGLGAGILSTALLGRLGVALHNLAQDFVLSAYVRRALAGFRMGLFPNVDFAPHQAAGDVGSEVAESVNQWAENMARQGNTYEEASEIMRIFESDMAAAEEMMPASAGAESVADLASGLAGSASEMADSWAVKTAADLASKGSSSAEAIIAALLKAGVPIDAVKFTSKSV